MHQGYIFDLEKKKVYLGEDRVLALLLKTDEDFYNMRTVVKNFEKNGFQVGCTKEVHDKVNGYYNGGLEKLMGVTSKMYSKERMYPILKTEKFPTTAVDAIISGLDGLNPAKYFDNIKKALSKLPVLD